MTGNLDTQRAQATAYGPSAVLRAQTAARGREQLIQRPRPVTALTAASGEWEQLAERRAELERLASAG